MLNIADADLVPAVRDRISADQRVRRKILHHFIFCGSIHPAAVGGDAHATGPEFFSMEN